MTNEQALKIVLTADMVARGETQPCPANVYDYRLRDGRKLGTLTILELHLRAAKCLREYPDLIEH